MAPIQKTDEQRQWLWASFKPRYFRRRHKLRDEHTRWRKVTELLRLSRAARHFGISRKTFYKWSARFNKEFLRGLEIARSVATKVTGHSSESVYRRYAIVSDADLQEAVKKLTGIISGIGSDMPANS